MSTDTKSELEKLTGDYTLDVAHTRIGFSARHAMVTKVRGAFNEFEGTAHIDGSDPSKSSVRVAIKTQSIDTRNEQRDGHLRANDFLGAEEFPEITFVSTSIQPASTTEYNVTGDLTIKGTTKSVTVPFEYTGSATDPFGNARIGLEGEVEINRKDWGVEWNAALETGGVLVSEKVKLEFEISAIKNA